MIIRCWYFFVEPLQGAYQDDGTVEPVISTNVNIHGRQIDLALFGSNTRFDFLRARVTDSSEQIAPDDEKLVATDVQRLKEHALSMLRLLYNPSVCFAQFHALMIFKESEPQIMKINYDEIFNQKWIFAKEIFIAGMMNSIDCAEELKLLTDGQDYRVPLQYRYLSLFKILELRFGDKLHHENLMDFLSPYQADFERLFAPKTNFKGYLIALRARCAHIRSNGDIEGITSLSHSDILEVEKALPFVFDIARDIVNKSPKNKGLKISISMRPPR